MGKQRKQDPKPSMREALAIVSKGVKGMITVNDMEEEIVCPTIFTSLNRATGIGGIPKRKMIMIHGPNSTGKSVLAAGLLESLRRASDVPALYECEFSAESRWLNRLVLGEDTLFKMPLTLDELFADIQLNLDNLEKGKAAKKLPDVMGLAIGIDTLTQLIPQEQWNTIMKEGIKKSFPMAAMWVSVWTKIIVPQAYRSNSTFVIVLQERQKLDATPFGKKHKVTLGDALLYDVSIRIECTHSTPVKVGEQVVGVEHHYKLEKNKVDGFTAQKGSIFTSTGRGDTPAGFDYVREAIAEGKARGVLDNNRKRVEIAFDKGTPDEETREIPGGWEDCREALLANNEKAFDWFVASLNKQARRPA
jgi:recombination protein RecA